MTGSQGPAGHNQISSTNLYLVVGNIVTVSSPPGSDLATSTATCQTGDVVIEGGYSMISATIPAPAPTIFEDGPIPDALGIPSAPNNSGYTVTIISNGGFNSLQAYAYCFNN